jgi:mRNA-degrading endonuclease YafQ of YafQ-DinJ toxin-antitoxin module
VGDFEVAIRANGHNHKMLGLPIKMSEAAKRLIQKKTNNIPIKIVARTLLAGHPGHIGSDWVLSYKLEDSCLIFERMGAHSDLFRK